MTGNSTEDDVNEADRRVAVPRNNHDEKEPKDWGRQCPLCGRKGCTDLQLVEVSLAGDEPAVPVHACYGCRAQITAILSEEGYYD